MKTAVAIRHLAFEDLGLIEPWLKRRGWRIVTCDAGVDELWKIDLWQIDLLVVLGGPIGAGDDALYPFLSEEVNLIRKRLDSASPLLGICLGAQLMARALGAAVTLSASLLSSRGASFASLRPLSLLRRPRASAGVATPTTSAAPRPRRASDARPRGRGARVAMGPPTTSGGSIRQGVPPL